MPSSSRRSVRRRAIIVAAYSAMAAAPCAAQLRRSLPDSLGDREFWQLFTTLSEEGGSFPSENFVSNEQSYQNVVPTLQRTLTPGGVYLGVGPEQNFTYIANLQPRLAVIFDIRRQNAMAHLMYKALFELSPTRAEFVSRLFSRPVPAAGGSALSPDELFAALAAAKGSDSLFDANWNAILERLTVKHGFALPEPDVRSIRHVYMAFYEAGPDINYGYRLGAPTFGPRFVTFADLQRETNADGVNLAFLADEEHYQRVRALHAKNLIVPVVGDFAGPKAIRGVAAFLQERGATVTAFYLSNVEQYLFNQFGVAERFYRNVATLPIDSTSTFIRSVTPSGGYAPGSGMYTNGPGSMVAVGPTGYYSVQVIDSGGVRIITTTTDSAGQRVTKRTIDSTGTQSAVSAFRVLRTRGDSLLFTRADSMFRSMRSYVARMGPMLVSGIASMRATLDAFADNRLNSYAQAIAMTKTDGWKQAR
jgi:hypothetical protein